MESLIAQNADLIQERKKLQAETKSLDKEFRELEELQKSYTSKLAEARRQKRGKQQGNKDRAIFAEG